MTCIWILVIFHPQSCLSGITKENIIFEQIGELAGATSYLHTHITISLSSIRRHLDNYHYLIKTFMTKPDDVYNLFLTNAGNITRPSTGGNYSSVFLRNIADIWARISHQHLLDIEDISKHLESLRSIMPDLPFDQHHKIMTSKMKTPHQAHPDNLITLNEDDEDGGISHNFATPTRTKRTKRGLGLLALPLAVAATAMGIYNAAQIEFLKHELLEVKENVKRLFEVVQDQERHMQEIDTAVREISTSMLSLLIHDPGLFQARLSRIENQIRDRLRIATHGLQTAQHRRLSVDYLSPAEIRILFSRLQARAAEFGCDLLVKHHSDLFQLEVSLLFDGEDAHILLHVPMIPQHSLLRLFKMHPFPLPFFQDTFLIPDVKNDVLAISSTDHRFSTQLSSVDLLGCHRVNQIFMCDRFGVLSRRFNHTCLGALYMQDFIAAQSVCHFEVVPIAEQIYQLKKNWFLVYLPKPVTVPVNCRNGTTAELHLSRGSQKVHISPGCEAGFPDHLLISDFSIRMPADIIQLDWEWDPLVFMPEGDTQVAPELTKLQSFGLSRPALNDIQFMAYHRSYTAGWFAHIIHFVGNLLIVLLLLGLVSFGIYRCYLRRRKSASRGSSQHPSSPPAVHYDAHEERVRFPSPYETPQSRVNKEVALQERDILIQRLSTIDAAYHPQS